MTRIARISFSCHLMNQMNRTAGANECLVHLVRPMIKFKKGQALSQRLPLKQYKMKNEYHFVSFPLSNI